MMQGEHGPFMPTGELTPDTKMITTWAVFQDYRKQIADRDAKIASLILERDALAAQLAQTSQVREP